MEDKFDKDEVLEVEKTFLSLEKDYIEDLMKVPSFYKLLLEFFTYSNDELFKKFSDYHTKMESGQVPEEEEDKVELLMIACVLALAEKVRRLRLVKVKEADHEEEELTNGRSR